MCEWLVIAGIKILKISTSFFKKREKKSKCYLFFRFALSIQNQFAFLALFLGITKNVTSTSVCNSGYFFFIEVDGIIVLR